MMQQVEVLIVGQGLAGSWLSWYLYQEGITFKIIDELYNQSASRRAAGLINPVTGRRMVTSWMVDELLPFTAQAYGSFGNFLGQAFIEENTVIDFFPTPQMLLAFQKRLNEDSVYLQKSDDPAEFTPWFNYDFGWGAIRSCQVIRVEKLLNTWRDWLIKNDLLINSVFDIAELKLTNNEIVYQDIRSNKIIFCDGASSARNPFFKNLPFALNKGEGMLVEIKNLPAQFSFKKGLTLVPYNGDVFWLGSSYEWSFENNRPSELFRKNAEIWLKNFLKVPFKVHEHFAALRPATLERRPFVGFHPTYSSVGILNGMGTKGCSLAPWFARELVKELAGKGKINALANIQRFAKILAKQD